MNPRLLFAAGRGARVQVWYRDGWMHTNALLISGKAEQRIHPDDAHLEYGPVSTALREAAAKGNAWDLSGYIGRMDDAFATYYCGAWWYAPELERSLYLLICSEYCADLGL